MFVCVFMLVLVFAALCAVACLSRSSYGDVVLADTATCCYSAK